MRVLHLSFHRDPLGRCGRDLLAAWPTLREHAHALHQAGADLTIVQAAARDETLVEHGVPFHFVRNPASRWARPARLFDVVRRAAPDVVHVHGLVQPAALWWLRGVTRPGRTVVQDHASGPPHGWRAAVWRRVLAGTTVAFTSRPQADAWRVTRALAADQPTVAIPEASSSFRPRDRNEARTATGMTGDPAVLWLGRLDANKDPLTVLEAVARAAERRPGLRLWMAWGAGPLEQAVRSRVAGDARLTSRVSLLGRLPHPEVERWLSAADVFVQASHREGSGYALIEALACGTPAVVTTIPAFRALLGDRPSGVLVPPDDPAAMAAALVAPLPARAAVRNDFDARLAWPRLAVAWLACYEALLAS